MVIIECNDNVTALRICKEYDKGKTLYIQFIYVTGKTDNYPIMSSRGVKFVFVGAIDKRKNIILVVKLLQRKYANCNYEFNIYVSWSLDEELRRLVANDTHIHYHGKQTYDVVRSKMLEADYLILPSLYDGWGCR